MTDEEMARAVVDGLSGIVVGVCAECESDIVAIDQDGYQRLPCRCRRIHGYARTPGQGGRTYFIGFKHADGKTFPPHRMYQ